MEIGPWSWLVLSAIVIVIITIDIVGHVRTPHAPSMKEAARWSAGYVSLAMLFGAFVWIVHGSTFAGQYFAGYATEAALSIDNLFVFVIIMGAFRVPRESQQKALLSGVIIALVLRLIFILAGAALVERFSWIFYIFGAWLLWTAFTQARAGVQSDVEEEAEAEYEETRMTRWIRKVVPVADGFKGERFLWRHAGKTYITPLFICVIALGSADIMFAFDSVPAIFGLTSEPYLIFAANAFALMGLRQLYFLIDGLLGRLIYLHYGLALILAFIGVKLVLHALHENNLPFVNGGEGLLVPEIGIGASLAIISGTLVLTVLASLVGSRRRQRLQVQSGPGPDLEAGDQPREG